MRTLLRAASKEVVAGAGIVASTELVVASAACRELVAESGSTASPKLVAA